MNPLKNFKFAICNLQFAIAAALLSLLALCALAVEKPLTTSRDYLIQNTQETVGLTIQKPNPCNSNFVEFYSGSNLKFVVDTNGQVAVAYGGTGTNTAAGARYTLGVSAQSGGAYSNITVVGASIKTVTNSDFTASLPVWADADKILVTKTIANAKLALGIQTGTCITGAGGKITNTFSTAFSSAPNVTISQTGLGTYSPTNAVMFVTTTNFAVNTSDANVTNQWIAIGAP